MICYFLTLTSFGQTNFNEVIDVIEPFMLNLIGMKKESPHCKT